MVNISLLTVAELVIYHFVVGLGGMIIVNCGGDIDDVDIMNCEGDIGGVDIMNCEGDIGGVDIKGASSVVVINSGGGNNVGGALEGDGGLDLLAGIGD